MEDYRISLNAGQFAALVRGDVVRVDCGGSLIRPVVVKIILQDIGYDAMQSALNAAELTKPMKRE